MKGIFELKQSQREALTAAEAIIAAADQRGTGMTKDETETYDEKMAAFESYGRQIAASEKVNTIRLLYRDGQRGPALLGGGEDRAADILAPSIHPKAAALQADFGAWARRITGALGIDKPQMEATAPSGTIGIGSGTGLDSVGFAIPLEVMPFLPSYLQFSPFEKAGAYVIGTPHMRPVNVPILSAGAVPSSFAEGTGPTEGAAGSQPMGLSGFQFGVTKFMRSVLASWESLQSTEVPLEGWILDELTVSLANVVTQAATQKLYAALTAPPNYTIPTGGNPPLQIVGGGSTSVQNDVYGLLQALRHSLPDGLEEPTNAWMLSRGTLSAVKNVRASTSGVPMFDAESDTIFGRPYVTNEYMDSVCGAGFIAYGNWRRGAFLRKCPTIVRPLLERYWTEAAIGFVGAAWTDFHCLAELYAAAQPPTWQPLSYVVLPSGSLE